MESHIFNVLEEYKNKKNISFAMPGHKNGRGINKALKSDFFTLDVTELSDTESLHEPGKALSRVLADTAEFFGADRSFILVNGSTSGIFTMLMSCCKQGDKVLINRCCHISVVNACIILGLEPDFAGHDIVDKLGIADTVSCDEIRQMLEKEKYSAVLITSPTYYGLTADIEKIAKITAEKNIPLLVDEAHGAHFSGNKNIFPKSAMASGADMCVQSAHKTLNAMNQTAFLHLKSKLIDEERVKKCCSMFRTASPCYPMVASADIARCELQESGKEMWERVHKKCSEIREKLKNIAVSPDRKWIGKYKFSDIDECRLVFNFSGYEITGFEVSEKLRISYGIDVEMADLYQIVLICTPSNADKDFEILEQALKEILANTQKRKNKIKAAVPPTSKRVMSPSEAFYQKGKFVELDKAAGCVAKSMIVPYPPGIAVLIPGEGITSEATEYIKCLLDNGADVHGMNDGKIEVIDIKALK